MFKNLYILYIHYEKEKEEEEMEEEEEKKGQTPSRATATILPHAAVNAAFAWTQLQCELVTIRIATQIIHTTYTLTKRDHRHTAPCRCLVNDIFTWIHNYNANPLIYV